MHNSSFSQRVASAWRNDPTFAGAWVSYMRGNSRAARTMPVYLDGAVRVWRASAPTLAHLTYSVAEDRTPVLLCGRNYARATTWHGWADGDDDRAARMPVCLQCRRRFVESCDGHD